jgi:ABC-type phosphate transport system auxiliary subunit
MKNLLFALLILFTTTTSLLAQSPLDNSTSFEDQRKRVNNLLNARNQKFGEYDVSLQQKTGIFGLFKSKNDMQKSIDILKQIVVTDNNIFIETRKLLDLKDSEKERYEQLANEYDQQVTAYMKTISKLQAENDKLKDKIKSLEEEDHNSSKYIYVFILIIVALILGLLYQYKQLKSKNVTKV